MAACSSGCCGPPASASPERTSPTSTQTSKKVKHFRGDGVPIVDTDQLEGVGAVYEEDHKSCAAVQTPCQDICSSKRSETPDRINCDVRETSVIGNYYVPNYSDTMYGNDGSSPELRASNDLQSPPCCEGKPAPCCDQSCLDRLALRECENFEPAIDASCSLSSSHTSSRRGRDKNGKPCKEHARKINEMYAKKLEALGCICRVLIALGKETCCNPRRHSSSESSRRQCKGVKSPSGASADLGCKNARTSAGACSLKKKTCHRKGARSTKTPGDNFKLASMANSCADSRSIKNQPAGSAQKPMAVVGGIGRGTDIESRLLDEDNEHVILSISGMTCTGCETKLIRTLGSHASVRNLKTSLVLSRAEFDLLGTASLAEVMKHLERTTEFKCERITDRGSKLNIIAPDGDAAAFVNRAWPDGVTDMKAMDKATVEVSFDARVVGARTLVERGWGDDPIRLARPRLDPALEAGSKHVRHIGYMTLLSACLTVPVLVIAWAPLPEHRIEYGIASLVLATLVQFGIAGPFYPKALKAVIFSKVIEMDLLVVLSTSAAYVFSIVSFGHMVSGEALSTGEFFETSTLLVTLIMVGRWVSALARQAAVRSISIRSLQTPTACLVTNDSQVEIDARLLQYGDVFKAAPDSRIPTDGTVISGLSEVDESMITGESRLVEKRAKSPVVAGSVNGSGTLHVRLTRLPDDNTISTIAGMVDEAKLSKPNIQNIADRVASYFVPVVVLITVITFCVWIAIGLRVRGQTGSEATIQAVTYAVTVLIVSCPCAIGLAVPMVIVIASGVAAERGLIFRSAESIEVAYKASHVVFDKTGTITEGKLTVAREWYNSRNHEETQSLLLGLIESVKHPVSTAVVRYLRTQGVTPSVVSAPRTLTGRGVEGTANDSGLVLQAGNSRWLNLTSDAVVKSMLSQGYTVFCFMVGGSVAATLGLQDSIRPEAASTIQTLLNRGISVHLISGDDDGAVRSTATQLSIVETNVRSRCTPREKQAYIQDLLDEPNPPSHTATRSRKAKKPVVIFCGDGANDAIALAQATIGFHMNDGGTDVAQSAADVVLMRPNLDGILVAINMSRKSIHRIAFNFGWSFVYNLFAILLAAGAFVSARIPPEFAGLGELVSVLPVIAVAMQLRWSKNALA